MKKSAIILLLFSTGLWAGEKFSAGARGDIMRFTSYDKYVGGGGVSLFYQLSDYFRIGLLAAQYQWGNGVERPAPGYDYELKRERLSLALSFRTYLFKRPNLLPYLNAIVGQESVTTDSKWHYYSLQDFSVVSTAKYRDHATGMQMGVGLGSEFVLSSKWNLDLNGSYLSSQYTNNHFLLSLGLNYKF